MVETVEYNSWMLA